MAIQKKVLNLHGNQLINFPFYSWEVMEAIKIQLESMKNLKNLKLNPESLKQLYKNKRSTLNK